MPNSVREEMIRKRKNMRQALPVIPVLLGLAVPFLWLSLHTLYVMLLLLNLFGLSLYTYFSAGLSLVTVRTTPHVIILERLAKAPMTIPLRAIDTAIARNISWGGQSGFFQPCIELRDTEYKKIVTVSGTWFNIASIHWAFSECLALSKGMPVETVWDTGPAECVQTNIILQRVQVAGMVILFAATLLEFCLVIDTVRKGEEFNHEFYAPSALFLLLALLGVGMYYTGLLGKTSPQRRAPGSGT